MKGFIPLQRKDSSAIGYALGIIKKKRFLSVGGFTLVEVMVTLFIFSIIFMGIFVVLASGRATWHTADTQIQVYEEIRKALVNMDGQLRQARSSVITGVPADGNYYPSIIFKVPQDLDGDGDVLDALGNIEWSGSITYALNADNQIMRTGPSGSSAVANNISQLQFMRPTGNPNVIQIYMKATKATLTGRILEDSINSSVKMRN